MTFQEVLAQVIDWLQRDKRVSYRALRRQFDLDEEYLDDLKYELVDIQQIAIDQDGKMLVWTGDPAAPEPDARRGADAESRFHALIPDVMGLIQREGRVTYRRLKYLFGLDNALLDEIREELTFRRLAVDEDGKGLVWTGKSHPIIRPAVAPTRASLEVATVTPLTLFRSRGRYPV